MPEFSTLPKSHANSNGLHQTLQEAPTTGGDDDGSYRIIKIIGAVLGLVVLLGGVVWSAASIASNAATEDDLTAIEHRLDSVEQNDVTQTVILENIEKTVDKIDNKVDEILKNK